MSFYFLWLSQKKDTAFLKELTYLKRQSVWSHYSHNRHHLKASFNVIIKPKGERISHCLKHTCLKKSWKGWPSVAAQTGCSKVHIETNKPVMLVSRLLYDLWKINVYFEFLWFSRKNNTQLMSVSMETDHLTKYQPSKNQSEHLELPQDYVTT